MPWCPTPGGLCLHALIVLFLTGSSIGYGSEPRSVEYNRDIRPILADKCFLCHGPDQGSRQADLELHTAAGAYKALASDSAVHAVFPGKPDQSAVYQRLTSSSDDERMPPPGSNLKLDAGQIELIRLWIEQGGQYQSHWAFLPPQKTSPPIVSEPKWGITQIDAFVLAKMLEHHLRPNPQATPEQLLRRVSFDLTGLPPTLAELDAFLAEPTAAGYEKAVDRLLASPRFGERLATEWLDVARYSDTYGFQVDRERFVWPWRDWVIRAFNRDLPYDQFLTQQLAGDLLPDAGQQEILATTFCRLHPQEAEGGSVPEEYRVSYVADRIQTVATSMLGMTLECCRCHDHKYDPLSQQEYFQLFAFFDDIDEAGLYSYFTPAIPTPTLLLTDKKTQKQLTDRVEEIASIERQLAALKESRQPAYQAWLDAKPTLSGFLPGEILHLNFDQVAAPNTAEPGIIGSAVRLTGDDAITTQVGNFHRYDPFSVSLWVKTPDLKERAVIMHRSRAWTDAGSRGYELLLEQGHLSAALIHFEPGNCIRIRGKLPLPLDRWQHVVLTYDGSSRADGLHLFVDGQTLDVEIVRDQLTKEITGGGGDTIALGERFRDSGFKHGLVDEFRVFDRELSLLDVSVLHQQGAGHEAQEMTSVDASTAGAREYYLSTQDAVWREQSEALKAARKAQSELIEGIPEIMVMREMATPKPAYVLQRGEYNLHGSPVTAATPKAFPSFPADMPRNRLGFARWLTSPEHPLTARVAVNRYWQMIFGAGLVRTTEDMGNQGEWPSHPELLDALSREWIEQGWSVKWLLKQMVMSETYKQSAVVSAEKEALDPANRWLSRAASNRLAAEMLRDNSLAISGLLVETIGGPPAKPYEMEAAFKPLTRDKGDGLYRRSLYTFWSRTGPAPVMMTLDAAKRDVCQVRRERTLSPLQPLVMLNGPQFVEAARVLAERVLTSHPDNMDAALTDLFRWTTSRHPTAVELTILRRLYEQHHQNFADHPDEAVAFLSVGDRPRDDKLDPAISASMAGVANMLLNFDECVFRR